MLYKRWAFVLLVCCLWACKDEEKKKGEEQTATQENFGVQFKEGKLPYQLTDTGLLKLKDTTKLPAVLLKGFVADSIIANYFGAKTVIKYHPVAKFAQKGKETYYMVRAEAGGKQAALLLAFDSDNNFAASYPFLLPDADPSLSQASSIDKNFTITKSVTERSGSEITGEGKEVVAYDASAKAFSLIMLDALHEEQTDAINPIDTFPKTNKLAGDYYLNKKNLVAIRDGRYANQLLVYIHTEDEEGECKGELKGEFLITSPKTATYRLGGDPCALGLSFSGNNVSINEERGCGNHRGIDCPLTGTFTKKKQPTSKQSLKKGRPK